ncbi:site-specific integrase [Polynucleobacter sp. UB-Raua-W9]|uniref:site-specific integrase n=1 Tax=Polynucleobacter sp. UB-Raua-W9 TaxID=1819736 RepID=UPI001BFEB2CB|nr:site-specific integrase [Polynucleobacter sp. UB-Raua-W9]
MASIQKRGSTYRVRITREGESTLSSSHNSRVAALQWAKEIKAKLALGLIEETHNPKPSLKTFEQAALCYRDTHSIHKKIVRSETYRLHILIKRWGTLRVEQVDKAAVLALRDDLLKLRRSGDTVNHYFNTISKLFQMLVDEWGLEVNNPIKGIKRMPPSKGRYKRLLEPAETALLEACSALSYQNLISIITIAIETGMRRSEIMGMTWQDVDLPNRKVYLHYTKNGQSRQVPLTRKAMDIFQAITQDGSEKIFSMSLEQLRGQFERAKKYAEAQWIDKSNNPFIDLRFHDLRHEALSRLSDAGLNVIELSCISGHKTLGMLQRYTHPSHQAIFMKLDRD